MSNYSDHWDHWDQLKKIVKEFLIRIERGFGSHLHSDHIFSVFLFRDTIFIRVSRFLTNTERCYI